MDVVEGDIVEVNVSPGHSLCAGYDEPDTVGPADIDSFGKFPLAVGIMTPDFVPDTVHTLFDSENHPRLARREPESDAVDLFIGDRYKQACPVISQTYGGGCVAVAVVRASLFRGYIPSFGKIMTGGGEVGKFMREHTLCVVSAAVKLHGIV